MSLVMLRRSEIEEQLDKLESQIKEKEDELDSIKDVIADQEEKKDVKDSPKELNVSLGFTLVYDSPSLTYIKGLIS